MGKMLNYGTTTNLQESFIVMEALGKSLKEVAQVRGKTFSLQ